MLPDLENAVVRKVTRRLVPLLFAIYFVNFLDRVNIGFAALQMNDELGLKPAMYGLAASIFYAGYILFEIPSNLLLQRFGGRTWLARIIVTWGVISIAQAAITSPHHLYGVRFLLGIAEAGFFPGLIYYLTCWYPQAHRAKAIGKVYSANTIAVIVGAPLSGLLMSSMHGLGGLSGWKWMFIVEGIPAVVLGIAAFLYLTDAPSKAAWLSDAERTWLTEKMKREDRAAASLGTSELLPALTSPIVWLLGLLYFSLGIGFNGITMWLPQLIKQLSGLPIAAIGLVSAVPFVVGTAAMLVNGKHSDKTQERRWHLAIPLAVGALGMIASAAAWSNPLVAFLFLCVATAGLMGGLSVFWSIPSAFLSGAAAAGGLALVNTIGSVSGLSAPYLIGLIRDRTTDFSAPVYFMASGIAVAAVLAAVLPYPDRFEPARASVH
ncbi:MFS transporter [Burkholderia ubonensis]|uniref:MFS transporter n=1 Tax=Burkholderia ubonensis TaxID=101571 RepID=UPI00075FB7C8|nr:MFS transporter [Burkholderia ubonensis]KWO10821.1 hypothetical protein WM25_16415 [Burkholderia ubonensis]